MAEGKSKSGGRAYKILGALIALAIAFAVGTHFGTNRPRPEGAPAPDHSLTAAATETSPARPLDTAPDAEGSVSQTQAHPAAPATPRTLLDEGIDPTSLEDDIMENYPEIPQSLLLFAEELPDKVDAAKASLQAARTFFTDLDRCMSTQSGPGARAIQALCLTSAWEVIQTYPDLKADYERLKLKASRETLELYEENKTD